MQQPKNKPQMTRQEALRILSSKGIDLSKEKVVLIPIRGYFRDTMGKPGVNDIGIYDDGFAWVGADGEFATFNGNCDPTRYKPRVATLALGKWRYKKGNHGSAAYGPYPAYRQSEKVTVLRFDGKKPSIADTGFFGINIHHGSKASGNSTSSLGCLTIPFSQWKAFKSFGDMLIDKYAVKDFLVLVIDESERLPEQAVEAPAQEQWREARLEDLKKGTLLWYRAAWNIAQYDAGYEKSIRRDAELAADGIDRYKAVSSATGVPWYVIAAIHFKEASCDFRAVLHNGQRIIGTGKKTTIVPIGKGPFSTWEEAAIDAIKHDGLNKVTDWSIENILKQLEAYNGLGYLKYRPEENSPYLWARTSINDDFGKYVADGKFDPKAPTNKTTGAAAILKEFERMGLVKFS